MKAILLTGFGGTDMLRYGDAPDPVAGPGDVVVDRDPTRQTYRSRGDISTASPANHGYVRKLGADRVIDYHKEDFTKVAGPCDVVFDTVGGEVQVRSYDVLKPGGRLVWIAGAPAGFQPSRSDVTVLRPRVDRDRAHLERVAELLEAGAVWPPTITRYKLADAAEAHRVSEGRHLQGKLVLEVR